jgi:hypothetical protein
VIVAFFWLILYGGHKEVTAVIVLISLVLAQIVCDVILFALVKKIVQALKELDDVEK